MNEDTEATETDYEAEFSADALAEIAPEGMHNLVAALFEGWTLGQIEDLANHGADAGWPGITYTSDCVNIFDEHSDAIFELAAETAGEMGYDNIPAFVGSFARSDMAATADGFKNLMVWFAAEDLARFIQSETEGEGF